MVTAKKPLPKKPPPKKPPQKKDYIENFPVSQYELSCKMKQKRNCLKMKNLGLVNAIKTREGRQKKCSYDHKDYLSYYREDDQRYCKEGCDLHKGKCAE